MPEDAAAAATEAPATGGVGSWTDPFRAYNFKVDLGDGVEGHFTECSGFGVKTQIISYREGGVGQIVHKMPGQVEYADITLRYGLTTSRSLWDWLLKTLQGSVERRHVSIAVMGTDGSTPEVTWDLIDAWPSSWRGAPLDALGREVAIESLTLTFNTLERV